AEDAGVVDEDVERAERVDGLRHDPLSADPRRDVVGVGNSLPAGGRDLVDHLLCRPRVCTGPVTGSADVVDDDLRTAVGEHQRVLTPDPPARARDDAHASVEGHLAQFRHGALLPESWSTDALPKAEVGSSSTCDLRPLLRREVTKALVLLEEVRDGALSGIRPVAPVEQVARVGEVEQSGEL